MKVSTCAIAVGAAVSNVLMYPVGALDVYNYLIQLKLLYHYRQNPYVATFQPYESDPFVNFGFGGSVPLFYGPVWLLTSGIPIAFVGFGNVVHALIALKAFNVVLLLLCGGAAYAYHDDTKERWVAVYAFLAHPLVWFEGVGNAHNDVTVTVFLVFALLAVKKRSALAIPLAVCSALVKFFTASLIPLVFVEMFRGKGGKRKAIVSGLLGLLVVVVTWAPFWSHGQMLSGLREGMFRSQAVLSASVFSLLREYLDGSGWSGDALRDALRACMAVYFVIALVLIWATWRGFDLVRAVVDTFLLFTVFVSLLYPWYLIPALAVLVLSHDSLDFAFLFSIALLGLLYYPLSVWAWFDSGMSAYHIHLFQALFLLPPIGAFLLVDLYRAGFGGSDRVVARAVWLAGANLIALMLIVPQWVSLPAGWTLPWARPMVATAPVALGPCVGDCGGDGAVSVNELLTIIGIAQGTATLESCAAADADHDGRVSISEILQAVNAAVNGCRRPTAKVDGG